MIRSDVQKWIEPKKERRGAKMPVVLYNCSHKFSVKNITKKKQQILFLFFSSLFSLKN